MTEKNRSEWPPLEAHIVGRELLGFTFDYPTEYLGCIEWGDRDFDAGGDGHALSFLTEADIKRLLGFVQEATTRRLVPFARGDSGDLLFCFDGEGTKDIYVIDLSEAPLLARNTGCANFVTFINDYRSQHDLPRWNPNPS